MVRKVLIPIAGQGSRMRPITTYLPKEMLPIINIPVIDFIIDEFYTANIKHFIFIISPLKNLLNKHIKNLFLQKYTDCKYEFAIQQTPNGLGDAILKTQDLILDDESFFLALPDNIIFPNANLLIEQMLTIFSDCGCYSVVTSKIPKEEAGKRAIVFTKKDDLYNIDIIDKIIDKPNRNDNRYNLAIAGRYLINNDIFNLIIKENIGIKGEIEFTNALSTFCKNRRVVVLDNPYSKFDIGSHSGYYDAFKKIGATIIKESKNPAGNRVGGSGQ